MRIVFASGYRSWWGTYPPSILDVDHGRTVGGGEAGMLMTAFGLAARGHEVICYGPIEPGVYRGVEFRDERHYHGQVDFDAPDALVAWSNPWHLANAPSGCARLLCQQLNDLMFGRDVGHLVDVLVSPAWNHAEFMRELGWKGAVYAVHNGCDVDLWADAAPAKDRPLLVGHWSSPDRGLHHVLRCWPRIRREVKGARLAVGYEINRLFAFLTDASVCDEHLERIRIVRDEVLAAEHDSSIEFLGAVSRAKLREYQKQSRVMAYPSDGVGYTEGFCVAAIEACAAGALPVLRPVDALPSLYGSAARWLPLDTGTAAFDDALVAEVVRGLTTWAENPSEPSSADLHSKAVEFSWARAAREMEEAIALARDPVAIHSESA